MLPQLPGQNELAVRTCGDWAVYGSDDPNRPKPGAVFPGAFNPFHDGHRRIAGTAARILDAPIDFELSISNVDKPSLGYNEVAQRVEQIPAQQTVWVTHAATFVEKANLFAECVFVVGADTITRIADPRYYGGHLSLRDIAVDGITRLGCRFLVFGRLLDDGFFTLADLPLPDKLRSLSDEVTAHQFRLDISSTELRVRGG